MDSTLHLAGSIITLIGSLFLLLAGVGLLRMPDIYNRMQTGTKATTLGAMFAMIGIAMYQPCCIGKVVLLVVFIFITNPVSSHAIARAALKEGIPLAAQTVVNRYSDYLEERKGGGR